MTKKYFGVPFMPILSPPPSMTEPAMSSPPSDGKPTGGGDSGLDDLIDKIEEWFATMDARFMEVMARSPDVQNVQCYTCPNENPGCCYQKILVTFMEAMPIVRALKRAGRDTPELRERLRVAGIEMEGMDRTTFFHEAHPCVFLEKGRCSIYAVRPGPCRSYYVVTEPARCQPGRRDGIGAVDARDYARHIADKGIEVNKALKLKENYQRVMMATLPRMVLLALETWDADDYQAFLRNQIWPSQARLIEWVDGENPFREQLYQIRKKAQ